MKMPMNWTFKDKNIANNFDRHVRQHLPWYDLVADAISIIAKHYVKQNSVVYDIGCSTGNMGNQLNDLISERNAQLIAIDNSESMASKNPNRIIVDDAASFEYKKFDLAICNLILQFLSYEQQEILMQKLFKQCNEHGAIIVVDKVYNPTESQKMTQIKRHISMNAKLKAGVLHAEITAKELSLIGIQNPINPFKLFKNHQTTQFFIYGEFTGWIVT